MAASVIQASGVAFMADEQISMEEFKFMADRAGLGMDQAELDHLKPIYELYLGYTAMLHAIDFGPEEMVVEFHPD
jgi:hypothetical protein|tara:strand:- start:2577 stop:2801 length:225 start_codon:yes stop_codon:yes gene_type:complete